MAKKKGQVREMITVECTTCRASGVPGVSRYSTFKNRRNTPDRLELKKYCKFEKHHTLFKEIK